MRRLLLCANPTASGFTGRLHREVLARFRAEFDVDSEWPKTPGDTRDLSISAAADGVDVVVAMGGDGVVHHVANGIGGTATALGVIPAGTTNVLARLTGIPSHHKKAADLICGPTPSRPIPSARLSIRHKDGSVDQRRATFSTGLGFDAEVVEVAEQEPYRKYRFGGIHYARSAASVLWNEFADRVATLNVTSGDRTADAVAVFVQLHAHYTYFGRLPLRFGTHQPGTATVLVAKELSRKRIASLLVGTATHRNFTGINGIEVWEDVERLHVISEEASTSAQADGELLGMPASMTITVEPDRLQIIAPLVEKRRRWSLRDRTHEP